MWEWIKELIGDACIILFVFWSLFILIGIELHGQQAFIEPNSWILYTEIGLALAFGVLSIERLVDDLKRMVKWLKRR